MADELNYVQPGDLITAELLNAIIAAIKGQVSAPSGSVDVLSLFGRTLSEARGLLETPGSKLQLGTVLDITGAVISATDPNVQANRVLSQAPPAGLRVNPGAPVNLVIASSSSAPSSKPTITSLDRASVPVNDLLHIFGTNFTSDRTRNRVTFGSLQATPRPGSSPTELLVLVPPGADALPQPVTIAVENDGGRATFAVNVTAQTGLGSSTVTKLVPSSAQPGEELGIEGTNFGTNGALVTVYFGSTTSAPKVNPTGTVTNTALKVTIPKPFPGLAEREDDITVRVMIKVGDKVGSVSDVPLTIFTT